MPPHPSSTAAIHSPTPDSLFLPPHAPISLSICAAFAAHAWTLAADSVDPLHQPTQPDAADHSPCRGPPSILPQTDPPALSLLSLTLSLSNAAVGLSSAISAGQRFSFSVTKLSPPPLSPSTATHRSLFGTTLSFSHSISNFSSLLPTLSLSFQPHSRPSSLPSLASQSARPQPPSASDATTHPFDWNLTARHQTHLGQQTQSTKQFNFSFH